MTRRRTKKRRIKSAKRVLGKRRVIPSPARFVVRRVLRGNMKHVPTTYAKLKRGLSRKKAIDYVRTFFCHGRAPRAFTYNKNTGRTAFIR